LAHKLITLPETLSVVVGLNRDMKIVQPQFGAVQAIKRLTRLSVWFIEQKIATVYSVPANTWSIKQ